MEPTLIESLAQAVEGGGLDLERSRLTVAIETDDEHTIKIADRAKIAVTDGEHVANWHVPSIRALFRGDRQPPDLRDPPEQYALFLFGIEEHVLTMASATGRPATDDDIKEAFGTIRRRPDGRSLGIVHDVLWQAVALSLGMYPTSEAELRALMSRLELSVRRWRQYAGSTAYSEFLLDHLFGGK